MFYTSFATFLGLLTLFGASNAQNKDFNHLTVVSQRSDSEQENWSSVSSVSYSSKVGTSVFFNFSNLNNFIPSGNPEYDYHVRYYIMPDVSLYTPLGYIDFFLMPEEGTAGYLHPYVVTNFSETFNLEISVSWRILNSDFPSITPFNYNYVFDMSLPQNQNYTYYDNANTSMYTLYTNQNSKNTSDILIQCTSMDQASWTKVKTNQEVGYTEGYKDGKEDGEYIGYNHGYADGQGNTMNPEMFTIFNGILNVALIPVNVFLAIFDFEVFGINITSLVASLLSIAILIIVIRLIAGSAAKGN